MTMAEAARAAFVLAYAASLAAAVAGPPRLGGPMVARACGHCVEDKIAATYDYGLLRRASAAHHVVVFAEIRGPAAGAGPELEGFVRRALEGVRGIDLGSVHVSLNPPAISFACDARRHPAEALLATASARLTRRGLSLVRLRVLNGPLPLPSRRTAAAG